MRAMLHVSHSGAVAVVEIDRPPMNALDLDALRAFMSVVERIEADRQVRCLVVTGRGRAFCTGEDLKALSTTGEDLDLLVCLLAKIETARCPVIAAINGFCIGGGFELALCCDLRLASTEASFVCAGVNVGLVGGTYRLPRLIGTARAKELLFTGAKVSATMAEGYGIVGSVHEPAELMTAAMQLATRIASRAPLSVEASKRLVACAHLPAERVDARSMLSSRHCYILRIIKKRSRRFANAASPSSRVGEWRLDGTRTVCAIAAANPYARDVQMNVAGLCSLPADLRSGPAGSIIQVRGNDDVLPAESCVNFSSVLGC